MNLNFQNIFLGILIIAIIAGIVVFSKGGGGGDSASEGMIKITMWGDIEENKGLGVALSQFNQSHQKTVNIKYTYVKPELFESQLIEAIADNKSPDSVLISNSKILRLETKLLPIPYTSIPAAKFDESYIEASKVFLSPKGIMGIPVMLDPIVTYWNHDMFTNAAIISGPKYWEDIINLEPKLTKRGEIAGMFETSAVALGEYENISHAKDILSTLFLQSGIPIVKRSEAGLADVVLNSAARTTGEPPIDSALRFYVDFANPLKTLYSWNRTQPMSIDAFLAEKLAIYFGRASDYRVLQEKNPHLKFDVGQIPQMKGVAAESTYAEVLGVSVLKASRQQQKAISAIYTLTSDNNFVSSWSKSSFLPPVRKDLLSKQQPDLIMPIFYTAAIKSKSWLDPKEDRTSEAFSQMITGLSSGRFQVPSVAASFLEQELNTIVKSIPK